MPYGYNGKILRVDLTSGRVGIETPGRTFYRRYMGGRAVAAYYLLKELAPGINPLSPDNILVFAASVITGAPAPAIPRYTVAAKSPMTGCFGESEAGGFWGPELKKAGFDAVVIRGRASNPVYLLIEDGKAEIRDASGLWGKAVAEVQADIRQELGDNAIRVASIGIGGENLVRYACILNEITSANGRSGLGAVMGSKNLKAIAVRGHSKVELADPDSVREIAKWVASEYRNNPLSYLLHEYGTPAAIAGLQASGMLPTRNFASGAFNGYSSIDGDTFKANYVAKKGCYACPIACKKHARITDPRFSVDSSYGSPEYETVGAFGSTLEIADANAIIKANELCNKYGLDTISTGVSIAFAMECFENGLLSKEDTGGLELRFGNVAAMLDAIELIAHRKGIGNLLAEGTVRAARVIGGGAERFCVHAKGLELPMHDPRAKFSVGLGYAVSVAGADHMSIPHDTFYETDDSIKARGLEALSFYEPVELLARDDRKVRLAVHGQALWSMFNVLGACVFGIAPRGVMPLDKFVQLVRAVTGFDTSLFDLMELGKRAVNLARVFNAREGFTRKDDRLSDRAFEPIAGGRLKGVTIAREDLERSLDSYYQMMGWDVATGIPLPETLAALDIGWAGELIQDRLKPT